MGHCGPICDHSIGSGTGGEVSGLGDVLTARLGCLGGFGDGLRVMSFALRVARLPTEVALLVPDVPKISVLLPIPLSKSSGCSLGTSS